MITRLLSLSLLCMYACVCIGTIYITDLHVLLTSKHIYDVIILPMLNNQKYNDNHDIEYLKRTVFE